MLTTKFLFLVPNPGSDHYQKNHIRVRFTHASIETDCTKFFPPSNLLPPFLHCRRLRTKKDFCTAVVKSTEGQTTSLRNKEKEARIRKQLQKSEFIASPYDTAWVAMVPSPGSLQSPCFPQCVEWILRNQHSNGSWGINEQFDSTADRDILLSTLACVIALRKWNVGPEHMRRGLQYVGRHLSFFMDEHTTAPIGFNLTFSCMLAKAIEMGLEFPSRQTEVNMILHLREIEIIKRLDGDESSRREAYVSYVAEVMIINLLDWKEVMKFQRNNGSLLNSPSTTAAALLHNFDDEAFQYLNSIVSRFGSAVPTMYPLNINYQLSIVDTLERVGISRLFLHEIKGILDMTYSLWLQRDEEIMSDAQTCAMAFRILRMNGYNVSSDVLALVVEASSFNNKTQRHFNDTRSILELYKASKVRLSEDELVLENIGKWSASILREILLNDVFKRTPLFKEVERAIKFPLYATAKPLDHKWNIENYDAMGSQMLKTKHLSRGANNDILALAVEDFCISQSIYRDEVQHLDSWEKASRLGELQFARQKLTYCHLLAAAAISPHELSDARVACAKIAIVAVVIDDFVDFGGSQEEVQNLTRLVEKWDEPHEDEFYSEQVKIIFHCLYSTTNQIAAMASVEQNRDVTKHIVETWLCLMKSSLTEVEWRMSQYVPTAEEYMKVAHVTFGLGPTVLMPLYFLGIKLPEYVLRSAEYNELYRITSTCLRLLNDTQTFEREGKQGKLNSVLLLVRNSGGSMTVEAAKEAIQKSIASYMIDILRLILREDSVIPKPCKEIFWTFCQSTHLFYSRTDGFSSATEMIRTVDAVINEPLKLDGGSPSLVIQSSK